MEEKRQTALVTGASSGIGRETAIRLAEKGFQVIAAARRMDRLNEVASQVQGITAKQVDLAEPEEVERFCQYLSDLSEPVSVLINNAGCAVWGVIEEVSLATIRRLFEVNLFALIRVTQACLPGMRRLKKATIVNVSSMAGKVTFPINGLYAATKHALEAASDALRMEVRPFGIRVVIIRPGIIATEFYDSGDQLSEDLLAGTDPHYRLVCQAYEAGAARMCANISIPGADLIANIILEAVLSEAPKTVYAAGPMVEEFLGHHTRLDDDAFDRFMTEKAGLMGLKV
jgi:short-subunit dehydrogenase